MYSLEYLTIKESNEMQFTSPFITVAIVTNPEWPKIKDFGVISVIYYTIYLIQDKLKSPFQNNDTTI